MGLYTPIHDRDLDSAAWLDSYMQLYVEHAVRQLINVRDLGTFRRFVRWCTGLTRQMLNRTQLGEDTGMSGNAASARLLGIQSLELAGGRAIGPHVRPDVRIVGFGRYTALRSRT